METRRGSRSDETGESLGSEIGRVVPDSRSDSSRLSSEVKRSARIRFSGLILGSKKLEVKEDGGAKRNEDGGEKEGGPKVVRKFLLCSRSRHLGRWDKSHSNSNREERVAV